MANTYEHRDYRPFIPECTKRGIGKTKAYELANGGLLETFLIGTKRYVYLDSIAGLPQRLALAELRASSTRQADRQAGAH